MTVKPRRAALAAERAGKLVEFSKALYRAYWVEDRTITDDAVIADVARAAGLDGEAIVAATGEAAIEQRLRDNTDAALAAGAFGAPAMVLDGELYWGNDRLRLLAWALDRRRAGAAVGTTARTGRPLIDLVHELS